MGQSSSCQIIMSSRLSIAWLKEFYQVIFYIINHHLLKRGSQYWLKCFSSYVDNLLCIGWSLVFENYYTNYQSRTHLLLPSTVWSTQISSAKFLFQITVYYLIKHISTTNQLLIQESTKLYQPAAKINITVTYNLI